MPSTLDIAYALFFAVGWAVVVAAYSDRRLKQRIAAGVPNARLNGYRRAIVAQWALATVVIILWRREARPWNALGLVAPNDWRLWAGLSVMVLTAIAVMRQNIRLRRAEPERIAELRQRMADVEWVLPHDRREYRGFMLLSCTAGVCEELLYRGFLTWLVAAYTGVLAAAVIVSVVFGAAHAYQGLKGILRTGTAALLFSAIVLVSGWLIPAMVIHALVDIAGGVLGFRVIGNEPPAQVATA